MGEVITMQLRLLEEVEACPVFQQNISADVVVLSAMRTELQEEHHKLSVKYATTPNLDVAHRADIKQRLGHLDRILYPEHYA